VHGQVGLLIALQTQGRNAYRAVNGAFVDGGQDIALVDLYALCLCDLNAV
jgi:hypothetical protein